LTLPDDVVFFATGAAIDSFVELVPVEWTQVELVSVIDIAVVVSAPPTDIKPVVDLVVYNILDNVVLSGNDVINPIVDVIDVNKTVGVDIVVDFKVDITSVY